MQTLQMHARVATSRATAAPRAAPLPAGRRLTRCRVAAPLTPARQESQDGDDGCRVFMDRDGEAIQVMCCDYGFRAGAGRLYQEDYGEVPDNVLVLARNNFNHELEALRRSVRYDEYSEIAELAGEGNLVAKAGRALGGAFVKGFSSLDSTLEANKLLPELKAPVKANMSDECRQIRKKLLQLKLNDPDVWRREEERKKTTGDVKAPWYIKGSFVALCWVLDVAFANRPIQRFWVLETVARIPYFAYISILHLYESLGFWRAGAELRKVHFAEEWNELHHLQIMEALGGDQKWVDRFIAEHSAILYYWLLIGFYLFSPRLAYAFSELVEWHATDTYAQFVETNEALLKELPPPLVAAAYYRNEDLYMFDELQTCDEKATEPRRPDCSNLYDVFINIRDDEIEHVKTMKACQDDKIAQDLANRRRLNVVKRG